MKLSEHFTSEEFACKHCGKVKVDGRLLEALEKLRKAINRPILINSGYRCPEHPIERRKKKPGYHSLGIAADIRVEGMPLRELYEEVLKIPEFAGIGVDPDNRYIHVDVRDEKARVYWTYTGPGWRLWDGRWESLEKA